MRPDCIYTVDGSTGRTVLRPGTRARFECANPGTYRLIGEILYTCGANGEWNPKKFPSCERTRGCMSPQFPSNGFFSGGDREAVFFESGKRLEFGCAQGFELQGASALTCLNDGSWSDGRPRCKEVRWKNKRFIAMAIVGSLLGLLLVILLAFLIQRQRLIRRAISRRRRLVEQPSEPRLSASQVIAAAASRRSSAGPQVHAGNGSRYSAAGRGAGMTEAQRLTAGDWMDPDRLALIAFAEGNGLPSYEEAMSDAISSRRGPPPFDAISTLSGYASRAVRRLPSLSSLRSREAAPGGRPLGTQLGTQGAGEPSDPHTVWGSNVSHGAISGQIGSAETMTTSEGSTAVTLETLSTCTGHTSSVRAQAGSISSIQPPSDHDPTSSTEVMPLLDAQGTHMSTEFGRENGRTVSEDIMENSGGGSVNLTAEEEFEIAEEDKTLDV